jgi:hypothetical protein
MQVPDWFATTGVMVKHARSMARRLKSVLEASVRRSIRLVREMQRDLDRLLRTVWSARACARRVDGPIPIRPRPELPGVKLTTYNTAGFPRERGNRHPSVRGCFPGKPPSPVMSRRRDGAVVVVRARESRVHGEGPQLERCLKVRP